MSIQRIVVVLGMHRSGTSAITRGLQALSVDLGDKVMPRSEGNNEKGFWEDADFNQFNEKLLAKASSSWARLSPLETSEFWKGSFATERYDAASMLESKLGDSQVFGLKDPRTTLLLPFWKCVFEDIGLEENYLIALRNPLEVAESLRKRNNFSHPYGLSLWAKHNWTAVAGTEGKKRLCVSYRKILDDPAGQLTRIAEAFDLPVPTPSSKSFIEYAGDFLSQELRHNRISDKELARAANVPEIVPPLYEMLLEWADASPGADLEVPAELKTQVEAFWGIATPLLAIGDHLKAAGDAASARAANSEKERAKVASELDESRSVIAETNQTLEQANTNITSLTSDLAERSDELTERDARISDLEAAFASEQGQTQRLERHLNDLKQEIAERDARITSLETSVASTQEQKRRLEVRLDALMQDIATRDARITGLEKENAAAQQNIASVEAHLEQAHARQEAFQTELADKTRDLRLLRHEAVERQSAEARAQQALRDQLNQTANDLKQQLASTQSRLKAAEATASRYLEQSSRNRAAIEGANARTRSLEATMMEQQASIAEKTTTMRLLRHEVLMLRSSTSWRVSRPLRFAKALLTQPRRALSRLLGQPSNSQKEL